MNTNKVIQFDFFKDPDISRLEHEIYMVKESANKVRKKLFAKVGELQKMYDELNEEHQVFRRNLCRGKENNED